MMRALLNFLQQNLILFVTGEGMQKIKIKVKLILEVKVSGADKQTKRNNAKNSGHFVC